MIETRMERLVWAFLTLSLLLGFVILTGKSITCHEVYRNDVSIKANGQTINAQAAKTEAEREQGLGGRSCLDPSQGMLFIFDQPAGYSFWMKDMRFNIDIVWISANKKVVYEQKNISPNTYPRSFTNPTPAQYVLEIAGGQADKLGLKQGIQLYY